MRVVLPSPLPSPGLEDGPCPPRLPVSAALAEISAAVGGGGVAGTFVATAAPPLSLWCPNSSSGTGPPTSYVPGGGARISTLCRRWFGTGVVCVAISLPAELSREIQDGGGGHCDPAAGSSCDTHRNGKLLSAAVAVVKDMGCGVIFGRVSTMGQIGKRRTPPVSASRKAVTVRAVPNYE